MANKDLELTIINNNDNELIPEEECDESDLYSKDENNENEKNNMKENLYNESRKSNFTESME